MIRKFRPDIQGLRAIAVSLVVLYHAGVPGIRGGFVGVDVFFVISGYLITNHLIGEVRDTGRISFPAFYARRIRRLLPAASVVTVVTVIGSWLWLSYLDAKSASVDALWTMFFGLNFRLAAQGVNYQANTDPSPLQHYWSLAVEEQFYLLWPAILIALTWWWARHTDRRTQPWALIVGLVLIVAGSLAWSVHETTANEPAAYFLLPARAWELGVGGLVALGAPHLARLRTSWAALLSVAGLFMLLVSSVWFTDSTVFPGYAATLPVAGAAVVIAAGLRQRIGVERVLEAKPFQLVGGVSYGWYLWHWPLLILLPGFLHHTPNLIEKLAAVGLGLWLAMVSSIAYENPLRMLPRFQRPRRAFVLGGTFVSFVAVAFFTGPYLAQATTGAGAALVAADTNDSAAISAAINAGLKIQDVPSNLTPSPIKAAQDAPKAAWTDGKTCMVSLQAVTVGGSCLDGSTLGGKVKVLLTGDSHAYEWQPAIRKIALQRGWQLTIITKSGCPLWDTTVYSSDLKRNYTECDTWRVAAYRRIVQLNPDIVITSAFVAAFHGTSYARNWNAGVTKTVDFLKSRGAPVVVIKDTPWPNKDIPRCIQTHLTDVGGCTFSRTQPYRDSVRMEGTISAAKAAGAKVIDPTNWLCTSMCPVIIGNTPVYHDDTHMTATYAAKLTTVLSPLIPKARKK